MALVTFSDKEESQKLQADLATLMMDLQDISTRLHLISYRMKLEDYKGRLQGYADIVSAIGGQFSELFEFYR